MTSELHTGPGGQRPPDSSAPGTTISLSEEEIRSIVRDEIKQAWTKNPASRRAALVASKGTLDWAYPPLILSTAAAAAGLQTSVFFTFYGLNIIHKDAERKLMVDPVGNPAMPMPVPMPDVLTGMPGMKALSTRMMKSKFAKNNVATISTLLDEAREFGVRLIGCQMTIDVFGYTQDDFVEGVEFAGAAAFMSEARKAHVTMFI